MFVPWISVFPRRHENLKLTNKQMKGHRCREAVSWVDSHSGFKDLINVFAKYNRRFKKKTQKNVI